MNTKTKVLLGVAVVGVAGAAALLLTKKPVTTQTPNTSGGSTKPSIADQITQVQNIFSDVKDVVNTIKKKDSTSDANTPPPWYGHLAGVTFLS